MDRVTSEHFEADRNQLGLLVSDHISAMLAYWDKDQICRFANKAYVDWFGKTQQEMINKMSMKELLGPIYEKNLPYITLALSGQNQTFERDIITPSNEKRNSIANYYPHLVDGQVRGFFVHVADVTPVKKLEKELVILLEREKQLNEIKSRFVSIASHEFRTPLSAITSSISIMSHYAESGDFDKMKKHFTRIESSVNNLIGILNDYLSLDKIEQNKIEIEYVNFNMTDFCSEIIHELSGLLKEGQSILHTHLGIEGVIQDIKILQHIIQNLLSNAIKYSEKNKDIFLITEVLPAKILFTIRDNGIGISEKDQENLFETFFRAKNVTNIAGTGLGLNIVKRYVDLLGGTINLQSKIGEGTSVRIELPRILH